MSCSVNVQGREFSTDEIIDAYLEGSFNDMILPSSESETVIAGVPLKMQLDTANGIAYTLAQQLIIPDADDNTKSKMNREQLVAMMDEVKKDFMTQMDELLAASEDITDPNTAEWRRRFLAMQNNYGKIENMVIRILAAQKFLKFNSDSVSEFLDFLDENEFRQFDDNFSFERDIKDSMSVRMKIFLMGMTDPDPRKRTWDNQEKPIDMDVVFNEVKNALTGMHPNYEEYKTRLREAGEAKPWLLKVVDKLETAEREGDFDILNEFVSAFTTHPIKMLLIKYSQDKDGNYTAKIIESNRHTISNIILDSWQSDMMYSSLYRKDDLGEYVLDKEKIKELGDILKNTAPTKENLNKFFKALGISLHEQTLNKIVKQGVRIANNTLSLMDLWTTSWGFNSMVDQLNLMEQSSKAFAQNNLFDKNNSLNIFRAFAREESKYADDVSLSSYITGGKSIASHGLNRYSVNKLRDLLSNRKGIRDSLMKTAFGRNAWLEMMSDPQLAREFDIYYADVSNIRSEEGDSTNRELRDLDYNEHLQLMFDTFFNQGTILPIKDKNTSYRIVKMLYLTMSDKKNKYILNAPMEIINNMDLVDNDGNLSDSVVDFIYEHVFGPEYARIRYEQDIESRDMAEYDEGRKYFYIFPELNSLEAIRDENGQVKDITEDPAAMQAVKDAIKRNIQNEFDLFLNSVMTEGRKNLKIRIDTSYKKEVLDKYAAPDTNKNMLAVADFFVTSMVTNFRVMQNISGDPAMHFKGSPERTWGNYAKRLAKDNASGAEYDNSENKDLRVLSLANAEVASEYLTKIDPAYKSMDSTDAQALMSVPEYARLLFKRGGLTKDQYEAILEAERKDQNIPRELLDKLLRPFKPVITADKYENGAERKVYIKFSAYPLVKNFTKGTELEGLRLAMKKGEIDLAAFSSAIKLGNVKNPLKAFDENRNFVEATDETLAAATLVIPRDGYKMQQEIPEKEKNLVNRGTQFAKLLFNNIRNLGVEELDTLEKEYDQLYAELYKKKADDLRAELMEVNADGEQILNFEKFNDIIRKELLDRQYDAKTLEYFKTELSEFGKKDYEYPFWAIPMSARIQPVINSIIDSRIRKTKFPGKAYVLGSSTGYKTKAKTLEEYRKDNPKGGIIPVKGYQFGKNLAPQRMEGDEVKPAEVILPWNFRDSKGELLDMRKYVKDGYIDFDKLPEELLTIQGFRIPTQGHNSMSHIKVVGFFTEGADNVVIAPAEYVTQMGSDFDVDKLYTYMKYYKTTPEGKIEVISAENSKDREKIIVNKILDIHTKVLSYPDSRVQDMIAKPLDYGMFDEGLHEQIYALTSGNTSRNFISPVYQVQAYVKASVAKDAVGAYSLSSTFNSMIQKSKGGFEIKFIEAAYGRDSAFSDYSLFTVSGNETVSTKLNESKTIRGNRTKADVISAIQSAAVDNENQNILEKINVTTKTMPVVSAMAHLGFHEDDIFYLLNQQVFLKDPSMVDGVDIDAQIKKLAVLNMAAEGLENTDENLRNAIAQVTQLVQEKMQMSRNEWKDAITNPTPYTDLAAVIKAYAYNVLGKKIGDYQRLLNLDSSGVKKNFFETWVFETKYRELFENEDPILEILADVSETPAKGYFEMYGKYYKPTHLSSILYFNELKLLTDHVYGDPRYSLLNTRVMKYVAEEIFRNRELIFKNKKSLTVGDWLSLAPYISTIESELVKFLLSDSPLFNGNMSKERERLYDKDTGLAEVLKTIQNTNLGQNNHFLKSLEVKIIGGQPKITFRAAKKIDESDDRMSQAVDDLYFNDRIIPGTSISTRQLMEDLVRYNMLEDPFQRATNFSRFIGADILKDMGIHKSLKRFDMNDLSTIGAVNDRLSLSVFTRQFIQNNPLFAKEVLVEKPNQQTYEYVVANKKKIFPGEKMIVKINNELYQSNGQYFQKIGNLFGVYDLKNPIIDVESNFNTEFVPIGTVKSSRDGEGTQSRSLRTNITKSDIGKLLDTIAENSIDPSYAEYASELRDKVLHLFDNAVTKFDENVPFARTVYMSQLNVAAFNPKAFDSLRSAEDKEKYILHELTHTVTKKAIWLYENEPDSLTAKQKNALRRLSSYRDLVRSTIKKDEIKAFELKKAAFLAGDETVKFSKRDTEILYASESLEEFVVAVMTSKDMQRLLDSFNGTKNKSLFKLFLELVEDILESFGINLTEGSLARQAFNDVMDIMSEETNPLMANERHSVFEITPNNPLLRNCLS